MGLVNPRGLMQSRRLPQTLGESSHGLWLGTLLDLKLSFLSICEMLHPVMIQHLTILDFSSNLCSECRELISDIKPKVSHDIASVNPFHVSRLNLIS